MTIGEFIQATGFVGVLMLIATPFGIYKIWELVIDAVCPMPDRSN